MKKESKKGRIFNLMQYCQHPVTGETLLTSDRVADGVRNKGIKNYAYILHDKDVYSEEDETKNKAHRAGAPKPPHYHICLQMSYPAPVDTVARYFGLPSNYVDIPSGNGPGKWADIVMYLTHEDERQQLAGKHLYGDDEVFANFDWRTMLDDRKRYGHVLSEKEQMRYDVMVRGKTLRQCMADNPVLYAADIDKLSKLRLTYISTQKPPSLRINYYVTGKGGVGKGLISRALARSLHGEYMDDDDIYFRVGASNALLEGYDGQPVIIWDDCRAVDLLTRLGGRGNVFNVFDSHPVRGRQNIKYGSISLCNSVNIVNSVQSYREFLDGLAGAFTDRWGEDHLPEDKTQAYRRFPVILALHEEDFDMLLNAGFLYDNDDYEAYIAHRNFVASLRRIHLLCGNDDALAKRLEAAVVAPVVAQHEQIAAKEASVVADEAEIERLLGTLGIQRPGSETPVVDGQDTVDPPADDVDEAPPWETVYDDRVAGCRQLVIPGCKGGDGNDD